MNRFTLTGGAFPLASGQSLLKIFPGDGGEAGARPTKCEITDHKIEGKNDWGTIGHSVCCCQQKNGNLTVDLDYPVQAESRFSLTLFFERGYVYLSY